MEGVEEDKSCVQRGSTTKEVPAPIPVEESFSDSTGTSSATNIRLINLNLNKITLKVDCYNIHQPIFLAFVKQISIYTNPYTYLEIFEYSH